MGAAILGLCRREVIMDIVYFSCTLERSDNSSIGNPVPKVSF
jgi:hypothetical protein